MERVIVGLGNPGGEYAKSRHNAGWLILDALHAHFGGGEWTEKKKAESVVASGEIGGCPVLLVKPQTFMNESGRAVRTLVKSMKAATELIVIHDDIDLPLGRWKISFDRGEAGHNGLKSISAALKTKGYIRIRIGLLPIGSNGKPRKPKGEEKVLKFVLGKFSPTEKDTLEKVTQEIIKIFPTLLKEGHAAAMNGERRGKREKVTEPVQG